MDAARTERVLMGSVEAKRRREHVPMRFGQTGQMIVQRDAPGMTGNVVGGETGSCNRARALAAAIAKIADVSRRNNPHGYSTRGATCTKNAVDRRQGKRKDSTSRSSSLLVSW